MLPKPREVHFLVWQIGNIIVQKISFAESPQLIGYSCSGPRGEGASAQTEHPIQLTALGGCGERVRTYAGQRARKLGCLGGSTRP